MPTYPDRQRLFWLRDLAVMVAVVAFVCMLVTMWVNHNRPHPVPSAYCQNNIRQVAVASHRYADRKGHFPGFSQTVGERAASWTMAMLPELGRNDVYDVFVNGELLPELHGDLLHCPSDRRSNDQARPLSYVINGGWAHDIEGNPANGVALDLSLTDAHLTWSFISENDGASRTLLFSENLQATDWANPTLEETCFVWHRTTVPRPEFLINGQAEAETPALHTARPSSNHSGGAMFAFCDGHVRFISEEIDYKVYMQLMTPHGTESDMPPEWKDYVLAESDYE